MSAVVADPLAPAGVWGKSRRRIKSLKNGCCRMNADEKSFDLPVLLLFACLASPVNNVVPTALSFGA